MENSHVERPALAGMGGKGEALPMACSAALSTEATPELRVTRAERTLPFEPTAKATTTSPRPLARTDRAARASFERTLPG